MDGVLRDGSEILALVPVASFNPCSNGWCTSSCSDFEAMKAEHVSILVLMDGVLRDTLII